MATIGHMKFKRELTEEEEKIMEEIRSTIQLDEWWLGEGQFPYISQIFEVCETITAKDIDFHQNERKSIITEIVHISFPFLLNLKLSQNMIESIEALQFLNSPHLASLCLCSNNITQMKSLRKCNFPKLQLLRIYQNKFVDLKFLTEVRWNLVVKGLYLQFQQNQESVKMEDLSFLFKMQSSIKRMTWATEQSIDNSKLKQMVGRRFIGIQLDGQSLPSK